MKLSHGAAWFLAALGGVGAALWLASARGQVSEAPAAPTDATADAPDDASGADEADPWGPADGPEAWDEVLDELGPDLTAAEPQTTRFLNLHFETPAEIVERRNADQQRRRELELMGLASDDEPE